MTQLESRHKEEKSALLRNQEREQEQFRHQCDKDVEKMRIRNKADIESRVCGALI